MPSDDHPAAPRGSILLNILSCPDCGATMTLTHIVPGDPGYQRLTFRCETCHRSETIVVKTKLKD
ncbi:transposase-like protein [Nitrobacteraceae bacterium AZCC 1564]